MEIVKRSPVKSTAGRPNKYKFPELKPGDCLQINNTSADDHHRISVALSHYKTRNGLDWTTTVRYESGNTCVYRIS